jgi:hypothetical protein
LGYQWFENACMRMAGVLTLPMQQAVAPSSVSKFPIAMLSDMRIGPLLIVLCVATVTSSGCANDPPPPPALGDRVETSPAMPLAPERDPVLDLLDYAAQLQQATPDARAEAVAAAREQVDQKPNAQSYAHLALAFGTAGQRRYTPDEATRYAQRALTADDATWSPAATQYLRDLARLYADSARSNTRSEPAPPAPRPAAPEPKTAAATDDRPNARARAHIRELERELDEARRKLRELAEIENRLGDSGS